MQTTEQIRLICDEANVKIAKLERAICDDFAAKYASGDPVAHALVASIAPQSGRRAVFEYLAKNPGSTYDEVPVKGAHNHLSNMLAYGIICVSGTRRGAGKPKNEYSVTLK